MNPILRSRRSSEPPGKNHGPVRLPGSGVPGQQASWPCDWTLPRSSLPLLLICRRSPSLRRRPPRMRTKIKKFRNRAFDRLVTANPDKTWPTKGRLARGITAPPICGPKTSTMEELADAPAQVSLGMYLSIGCVSVCSRCAMKKTSSGCWGFHCFGVYFLKGSRNDAVCPGPPSISLGPSYLRKSPRSGRTPRQGPWRHSARERSSSSIHRPILEGNARLPAGRVKRLFTQQ
jgi:hypothetical protein